jgi:hypothetical protein
MPETMGEYVDRLVTIEMRNPSMTRGITKELYDAAREEGGGRPLTLRAAEGLVQRAHQGDNVFIITGAGAPPVLPRGESDGPPGAAVLARALYLGIGATPIYLAEEHHMDPIIASSETVGVSITDYATAKERHWGGVALTAPTEESEVAGWAASIYDTYKPAAVISTERLGPNEKGIIHGATGLSGFNPQVDLTPIITEAERRGVLSIGIGDNGNELGFGRIHSAVKEIQPWGKRCQCPCESGMATVVKTDVLVAAFVSNWGCYGIAAMLAFLLRKPNLAQSPDLERRNIYACLEAGGLEAMGCTKLFSVDGAEGETSVSVVQMLGDMVRIALAEPYRGPAH